MLILVFFSALLSGSEVAIFSLNNEQKNNLQNEKGNKKSNRILFLLEDPKKLLATILIANNLINVSIVMVSSFVINHLLNLNIHFLKVILQVSFTSNFSDFYYFIVW